MPGRPESGPLRGPSLEGAAGVGRAREPGPSRLGEPVLLAHACAQEGHPQQGAPSGPTAPAPTTQLQLSGRW